MTSIEYIEYYIPENYVTISDFINHLGNFSMPKEFNNDKEEFIEFLERYVGLTKINIEDELDEYGLMDKIISGHLSKNVINPKEVDLIINFSEDEYFFIRNCGHYIKQRFGFVNADVMQITGNSCANLDIALAYSTKLISSGFKENIFLCGGNKITDYNKRVAGTFSLIGDAYGVVNIKSGNSALMLKDFEIVTVGNLYQEDNSDNQSDTISDMYFKCFNRLFLRNRKDEIKEILIPNGFPLLLTQCLSKLGFNKELIFNQNIAKGHFTYLDSLINLKDFIKGNPTFKGEILLFNFSWAGTAIASIYTYY